MHEILTMSAPKFREKKPRLTAELKELPVDENKGVRLDNRTAGAVRDYGRRNGWIVTGRKDGEDHQIVWRVG